jgi:hypothetical protein
VNSDQIVILMAGTAFNGVDSVPVGASPDVHDVRVAVVSLARIVTGGVTVHTARIA